MIKLFTDTDKKYNTNGDVVIIPFKCVVKNEDNGDYYLTLTLDLKYIDVVKDNSIIVAPTPNGEQAFRVRLIEKRINRLEIKAYHVYYDTDNYVIADSYAVNKTAEGALTHFNLALDSESPYMVYSDIEEINNLRIVRDSFRECIEKVRERWGGHIVRDNWIINLKKDISNDYGVNIEYGKNLSDITATYDWSEVVTKLLPVGKDGTLLDSLYIYAPVSYDIPFSKVVEFQQDIDQEDYETEAAYIAALKSDLYKQARAYVNDYCYPRVNYTLKANPERVHDIGDVIRVHDKRLNIDLLTQVTAYEYDAFNERFISLEFGNYFNTLSNALNKFIKNAK